MAFWLFLKFELLSSSVPSIRAFTFWMETTFIRSRLETEVILRESVKRYLIVVFLPVQNPRLLEVLLVLVRILLR